MSRARDDVHVAVAQPFGGVAHGSHATFVKGRWVEGPDDLVLHLATDLGADDGIGPGHVLNVFQRGETIIDPLAKPPVVDEVAGRKHLELNPENQGGVHGALVAADDYVVNLTNSIKSLGDGVGTRVEDWQKVKLPDELAGTVMVFRSYDNLSYALVMEAKRAMHVYDGLQTP